MSPLGFKLDFKKRLVFSLCFRPDCSLKLVYVYKYPSTITCDFRPSPVVQHSYFTMRISLSVAIHNVAIRCFSATLQLTCPSLSFDSHYYLIIINSGCMLLMWGKLVDLEM